MAKRCLVFGIDGVGMHTVLRLMQEGKLPNLRRVMEEGAFAPHCLSSVPTSTPENWTTIATGAWNGTHQVMSFQVFQPPELHGNWMAGYTSAESKAEFIWDALERAGKQSIILKYPASHPCTMRHGVQVCGCHVRPCAHQIEGARMFATVEPRSTALHLAPLTTSAPFQSALPLLMGELYYAARGLGAPSVGEGLDERSALYGVPDAREGHARPPAGVGLNTPVCKIAPPGKSYYLWVSASDGTKGYDRVTISRDMAGQEIIASLAAGEWSPWLLEKFETVDGPREGTMRFKLEALSSDARVVKLYASQIMDVDHYTYPLSVGRELYEQVGPFITDIGWEGLGHDRSQSWFGEEVMVDLAEYQHDWFVRAADYLMHTRDWSLCMMQLHCIDCANHHCLHLADPFANPHDPALRARYQAFIDRLYDSVDRTLGRIMALLDEETVLFVVSDHGGLPGHLRVNVSGILERAGLLTRDAQGRPDWTRTRAYVQNGIFVNVNLQGRDPHGIVAPEAFDRTCDEIIAALHAYVEPSTGLHPVNLALRRVDMRYLGLYGDPSAEKVGDVVFTLREPFGGNHGEQLSTAQWGVGSNTSLLVMRGPGIRRGVRLERTVWLTDIVPTICRLLDMPVPRQCEGAILYQALDAEM